MTKALPCIRCGTELENIQLAEFSDEHMPNQSDDGLAFVSYGHYGTMVFDPMDGSFIELNVCDGCLKVRAASGHILHRRPSTQPRTGTTVVWTGVEHGEVGDE